MDAALLGKLTEITEEEARLLAGGGLDKDIYTTGKSFVVDRKRMLERGRLMQIRPHTRFASFPPHSHNYVEMVYMAAGRTTHMINGETPLVLNTGELLLLNQHVTHSIEAAGAQDIAVNFIMLPPFFDFALELIGPDNPLGRFLLGSLQQDGGDIGYLHFRVNDILPVQNLVENLVWSAQNRQPGSRRGEQVTMGLLFLQLLRHTERMDTAASRSGHALVLEALREIEENYNAASLSLLAQKHRVSVAYVSRLVRQATGSTFKALLQDKRLARAVYLLKNTRLSVGEIIAVVGYDNTSYFFRIFRGRYGVSPQEYRKEA